MKKIAVKVITISSLVLVVSLFMMILFSKSKNSNEYVFVVENDNLCKMDNNTSLRFRKMLEENIVELKDDVIEDLSDKEASSDEKLEQKEDSKEGITEEVVSEPVVEVPKEEETVTTTLSEERDVLQTVVGNLTGYGADCYGCSGLTSTGFNLNNSIYYEDSEFGSVRILAADPTFPFYSIFRVSGVPGMDSFIGIVLDRGGNVGFGRGTLFDLAFESESSPDVIPLTRNVTFELLRSGR